MKKEPLSTMTVKILLAVIIFVGMGTIIVGGGYIIGEYSKNKVSNQTVKPVNQETENYYNLLEKKCNGDNCCLSSLKTMRANNYKEADKNGNCPEGFFMNMMKCITSYQWCEPIGEKCVKEGRILSIEEGLAGFPCCDGLNQRVHYDLIGDECVLEDVAICINCPNGECGLRENKCNCPEDCGEESDTSDWQTYWNEEFGFEVKYPEDWDSPLWQENEYRKGITFGCPKFDFEGNEYCSLSLSISKATTKDEIIKNINAGAYKEFIVDAREAITYHEADMCVETYTEIFDKKMTISFTDRCSVYEGDIYNQILSTFKFIEK